MDVYFGYNQIRMAKKIEKKTNFMTDWGIYYYLIMPFELRNVGATYHRLVNRIFKDQIDCTIEVYVDGILVKSRNKMDHVDDF